MYKATRAVFADHFGLLCFGVVTFAALWLALVGSGPVDDWSRGVVLWWTALCALSVVNLCGWRLSAAAVARRRAAVSPTIYLFQWRQLLLSAVYVLGCGFRAVLPRADVQRIGLYDSWISSVMVGRSVATVAELCFIAQWALLLHKFAKDAGSRFGVVVAWLLVPMIVVAEVCSWYAVLTTAYLGNAIEESIWALAAGLLILSGLALWSRCRAGYRPFLAAAMALGVAYVAFMCTVDVPMYVTRWLADEASGRTYLSLGQGIQDAWCRWKVTFEWDEWRTEIPWMSLYFSVAVWWSIALIHAPSLEANSLRESYAPSPS
ncbi:hypothetical protein AYO44_03410 [Planctomycetaceae bacterium SCGC AG-212-F19]|nr:hypothetical protein AYO44_03410 [Planctomycetaceae bacterium SCGC AG-212-F19]